MKSPAGVVCAGIIVVDHIAAPVPSLPEAGQLVLTDECFLTIGGCASNVAIDLARLGISTMVAGCVGNDPLGDFAARVLAEAGVDTARLTRTEQAATSQTLILNVRGQDRRFVHLKGANDVFSTQHLPWDSIAAARVLYVGGYFLMNELRAESLADVFRKARAAGVVTALDVVTPGPRDDYMQQLSLLLPHTDVFLPNEDEARLMTGLVDSLAQAETFQRAGAGTVVITRGGQGSLLLSRSHRLRAGVFPVEFVDGTGGGDAFDAGYIRGILEGASPEQCLALGSALGASCVRRSGATAGVFDHAQLEAFLRTHTLSFEPI